MIPLIERLRKQMRDMISDYTYSGSFKLASGMWSDTYIDCRALILEHSEFVKDYLIAEIRTHQDWRNLHPVATGAGGALMLGILGEGYLWNPKDHGIEWSPDPVPGMEVIILDDVLTTGGTLISLREACEKKHLTVKDAVVLHDRRS